MKSACRKCEFSSLGSRPCTYYDIRPDITDEENQNTIVIMHAMKTWYSEGTVSHR